MEVNLPSGATPLDPDEAADLIPQLATQSELNEFESANILRGISWAQRSKKVRDRLLSDEVLRELHRKMFGETWRWAGTYRKTLKSIGCEAWQISTNVRNLAEDVKVWIENGSYSPPEVAARFHHKLVWIHPFPNGNGRFARVAADLLCEQRGWLLPTWGSTDLGESGAPRQRYIDALRSADRGHFLPLLEFMVS